MVYQNLMGFEGLAITVLGVSVVGLSVYVWKLRKKEQNLEQEYETVEEQIQEIQRKNRSLDDRDVEDGIEEDLDSLASKLMSQLKDQHDLEATTYKELVEELKILNVDDATLKQDLISFYKLNIKLQYSDEELSDEEKEEIKRRAQDLIRKTEESP